MNESQEPESEDVSQNAIVTPKTINVFSEFAVTLKRIHIRLISAGYTMKDGVITKSERLLELEKDNIPPKRKSSRIRKD